MDDRGGWPWGWILRLYCCNPFPLTAKLLSSSNIRVGTSIARGAGGGGGGGGGRGGAGKYLEVHGKSKDGGILHA